MTNKDRTIDAALNAAVLVIQEALGINGGGFASAWWTGDREATISALLGEYYDTEIDQNGASDPDAHLIPGP